MTEQGILQIFESHQFLADLSERHRMTLASGAKPLTAPRGEYLAKEGQSASAFYLIQSGSVDLLVNRPGRGEVTIQTVGPGEVVGWSWLVPPHQWAFDCRTAEDVKGLSFDTTWLRDQCECDHELGYHLLRQLIIVLANRLAATRWQLLDIYK